MQLEYYDVIISTIIPAWNLYTTPSGMETLIIVNHQKLYFKTISSRFKSCLVRLSYTRDEHYTRDHICNARDHFLFVYYSEGSYKLLKVDRDS